MSSLLFLAAGWIDQANYLGVNVALVSVIERPERSGLAQVIGLVVRVTRTRFDIAGDNIKFYRHHIRPLRYGTGRTCRVSIRSSIRVAGGCWFGTRISGG